MNDQNFTTTFSVDKSAEEVFNAITNVRGWWSKSIEGETDREGAVFYYHYNDAHQCTIKITELTPGKKVAWHVLYNTLNFTKNNTELTDTDVVFDIEEKDGETEVRFTHVGLTPALECYDACSGGWSGFVTESLRDLIVSGQGQPNED
jgi:uncharacterized protein YndB with AHSA1/START domain